MNGGEGQAARAARGASAQQLADATGCDRWSSGTSG